MNTPDAIAGKVDKPYFVGAGSSEGHLIRHHSSERGVERWQSRCAGQTRTAAKRKANWILVPSRQMTCRYTFYGALSLDGIPPRDMPQLIHEHGRAVAEQGPSAGKQSLLDGVLHAACGQLDRLRAVPRRARPWHGRGDGVASCRHRRRDSRRAESLVAVGAFQIVIHSRATKTTGKAPAGKVAPAPKPVIKARAKA